MKKEILALIGSVLLLLVALFGFRGHIFDLFSDELTRNMFVDRDEDSFDPGLAVGEQVPALKFLYQGREYSELASFMGPRGLVLVASRSVDWCPYCMRQMSQLGEEAAAFREAGIGLVGLTYDAPALQQAFAQAEGLDYPLLSDVDAASVQALGILNRDYRPGDDHFGIPYPGTFIIAPDGRIVGKLFLDGYRTRVDADSALEFAETALP